MGAVRERAQLIDEGFVPVALDQLDEAVLALRTEWIGAGLLVADLCFGLDRPAGSLPARYAAWNLPAPPGSFGRRIDVS